MKNVKIAIYGGGGFGREAVWMAEQASHTGKHYEIVGFIDDNPSQCRNIPGRSVFTLADAAERFPDLRVVIAIGDPKAREHVAMRTMEAGLDFETLVHPSVIRPPQLELGSGSILCAGSVFTTDIAIGQHVQINLNSTIGHDVLIGDCTTLGPGVHIAGFVNVGKRVFIGAGAVIINGSRSEPIFIGDDAMVGAGSCVIRSLAAGSTVFGNPARPVPRLG
jgi:sugar O-acyltransferase (sialic acid O-acetyltransferase NeuD family)